MDKYVFSNTYEDFRIVVFQNNETFLYGFSIHERVNDKDSFKMKPLIYYKACIDLPDSCMRKANAIMDCFIFNDIKIKNLIINEDTNHNSRMIHH